MILGTFGGRDTQTMRDRFGALEAYTEFLKKELEEYITSPVHSLELRWAMFKDAPKELSRNDCHVYHGFDHILKPGADRLNWVDDLLWSEKYETINLVDLVEEEFSKPEDYDLGYDSVYEEGFLDKIKEQILKDNIKSFIYDW